MNEYTHLDLCSGIGGFSLGLEAAGFRTIGFSEIDPFASAVLLKHWPHVVNYGDIRDVPAIRCFALSAGFPCQPYSVAGRKMGANDPHDLWPSVLAVIERCQPNWFVGENVVGIKNMVLGSCLDELADRGYLAKAFDIPNCAAGLQSVERHIWIVASRHAKRMEGDAAGNSKIRPRLPERNNGRVEIEPRRWDLPASRLLRSRKGVPNFVDRIKCLGNAVPPQTPFIIGKAIISTEEFFAKLKTQ